MLDGSTVRSQEFDVKAALIAAGEKLSETTRDRVAKMGADAVPSLVEIFADEELANVGSAGDGWAPIHAADLLGAIGDASAIPHLLGLLERSDDPLSILYDRTMLVLGSMGRPVLEPALSVYNTTTDEDFARSLRCILASLGVKDERIFKILIESLKTEPDRAAMNLSEYGDSDALPALGAALDVYPIDNDEAFLANQTVIELVHAIEECGGQLTASQQHKYEQVIGQRDAFASMLASGSRATPSRRNKIGRNAPCWCGSGTKYKRCHLREDRSVDVEP